MLGGRRRPLCSDDLINSFVTFSMVSDRVAPEADLLVLNLYSASKLEFDGDMVHVLTSGSNPYWVPSGSFPQAMCRMLVKYSYKSDTDALTAVKSQLLLDLLLEDIKVMRGYGTQIAISDVRIGRKDVAGGIGVVVKSLTRLWVPRLIITALDDSLDVGNETIGLEHHLLEATVGKGMPR